jgi:hypothetical protein
MCVLPDLEKIKMNEQTKMEMRRRIGKGTGGDGALIICRHRCSLLLGF